MLHQTIFVRLCLLRDRDDLPQSWVIDVLRAGPYLRIGALLGWRSKPCSDIISVG